MNFCCGSLSSIMDRNNERPKLNRKFSNKENNFSDYSLLSSKCATPTMNKGNFNYDFSLSPDYSMMSLCISDKTNHEDNLERYLMSLNQEFLSLGLPTIFVGTSTDADIKMIVFNSWKIIQMLRQNNKTRYSLELQQNKSESEVKHMLLLIENLKNEVAIKDRELKQQKLTTSLLEAKNNEITKSLKTEKDEVKKLNSIMGHRDSQFKNDLRKRDMEITKLKERLTQKVALIKPAFELMSPANRKNIMEIDPYRDLVHGYELKEGLLKDENLNLRNILSSIFHTVHFQIRNDNSISSENGITKMDLADNVDDILKMPVDAIQNMIEANFETCISHFISNNKNTNAPTIKKLNETFTLNDVEENSVPTDDMDQLQSDLNHFKSLCDQQTMLIQNLLEVGTADVSFLKDTDHLDKTIVSLPEAKPSNQLAIISKLQKHDMEKVEIDKMIQDFYDITPLRNGKPKSARPLSSSLISLQMTPGANQMGEMNRSTPSMINISCKIPSTFDLYKTLNYINSPGFICTLTRSSERRTTSIEDMGLPTTYSNKHRSSTSNSEQQSSASFIEPKCSSTSSDQINNSKAHDALRLRAKLF